MMQNSISSGINLSKQMFQDVKQTISGISFQMFKQMTISCTPSRCFKNDVVMKMTRRAR